MRARLALLYLALATPAFGQAPAPTPLRRDPVTHFGKWLTAGATAAFTIMAARQHDHSHQAWNELLDMCRSAADACARQNDGTYVRFEAEALYQRSIVYDRRANRRLLGAQASLLATAALFILDLRGRTGGPDNIPFSPIRVTLDQTRDGALVGIRIAF